MIQELSFDLHALVARLDRSADKILSEELGVSYRRFLPLFMVRDLGAATQRALAERLDVSEPSVSRMTAVLAQQGLLDVEPAPGGGNRRRLRLTAQGDALVDQAQQLLARRFAELVSRSGIPANAYAHHTKALLRTLDAGAVSTAA